MSNIDSSDLNQLYKGSVLKYSPFLHFEAMEN